MTPLADRRHPPPAVPTGAANRAATVDTVDAMRSTVVLASLVVATLAGAACGSDASGDDPPPTTLAPGIETTDPPTTEVPTSVAVTQAAGEERFPDVLDASAERVADTWTISATLSSPYDAPERYADAWRVVGPDGTVYGERILTHDHANEQPFTRSESGIEIPDDVTEVIIEGRDLEGGYGGATFTLRLPN